MKRVDGTRTQRRPAVLLFHVGDLCQHLLERIDGLGFLVGQRRAWMKMRQQHDQRIADAAELFAIGGDVGEHVGRAWILVRRDGVLDIEVRW